MKLNELFVSYSQVDPIDFSINTPDVTTPETIYLNRDRARKIADSPSEEQPLSEDQTLSEELPSDFTSWKVQTYNGTPSAEYDDRLIDYLKSKEGFRESVYSDSGGVATIGYGFTDPAIIAKGTLSEQEATELLKNDIANRIAKLRKQIHTWDELSQNQRDALTSYGFNVGVENWAKTQPKLLAALNAGRYKEAAKYMDAVRDKKGVVQPGLVKRRKEEQEWFNS